MINYYFVIYLGHRNIALSFPYGPSLSRSLDHQVHGAAWGTLGPIKVKLLENGALDGSDAHAIVGLVLGAFGELPTSCYSLCTSIARVAAARLLCFGK
jgi:hypothetical protein